MKYTVVQRSMLCLLVALLSVSLAGQEIRQLAGTWIYQDAYMSMEMVIHPNSTIEIDGITYPLKVSNNQISIEDGTGQSVYPYSLSGNQLTLVFPGNIRMTFSRAAAAQAAQGSGTPTPQASKQAETSSLSGNKYVYSSQYGTLVLHFLSDTELEFDGERSSYRISGNTIQALTDYGWQDYPYRFEGKTLWITFPDGTSLPFSRSAEAAPQAAAQTTTPAAGNAWQLQGSLCYYSGSSSAYSSYSRVEKITFDGKGNFVFGNESSFSSDAGLAYGNDPNQERGTYRIAGKQVILNFLSGAEVTVDIHMVQDNGRITELMYRGKLYATGLCE